MLANAHGIAEVHGAGVPVIAVLDQIEAGPIKADVDRAGVPVIAVHWRVHAEPRHGIASVDGAWVAIIAEHGLPPETHQVVVADHQPAFHFERVGLILALRIEGRIVIRSEGGQVGAVRTVIEHLAAQVIEAGIGCGNEVARRGGVRRIEALAVEALVQRAGIIVVAVHRVKIVDHDPVVTGDAQGFHRALELHQLRTDHGRISILRGGQGIINDIVDEHRAAFIYHAGVGLWRLCHELCGYR